MKFKRKIRIKWRNHQNEYLEARKLIHWKCGAWSLFFTFTFDFRYFWLSVSWSCNEKKIQRKKQLDTFYIPTIDLKLINYFKLRWSTAWVKYVVINSKRFECVVRGPNEWFKCNKQFSDSLLFHWQYGGSHLVFFRIFFFSFLCCFAEEKKNTNHTLSVHKFPICMYIHLIVPWWLLFCVKRKHCMRKH